MLLSVLVKRLGGIATQEFFDALLALEWCKNNGYETLQEGFDDEAIYWTEWETPSFITNL